MNTVVLRRFWEVVEETQTSVLLRLSDSDLAKQLRDRVDACRTLSDEETYAIDAYIRSKTALIRDLAESRQGC